MRALLPRLLLVGAAAGLLQTAQGVGLHEAAGASALSDGAADPHAPLTVGDAAAGPVEVLIQQRFHAIHDLLLVPRGIEDQGVQHVLLPGVLLLRLAQRPPEPRRVQALRALRIGGMRFFHHTAGIVLPQLLQYGTIRQRPAVGRALQSQPEQAAVQLALGLVLKGVKQRLEAVKLVIPVHKADDGIEIQLRLAIAVIGLELRTDVIVFRAVPHLIGRTAALDIFSVHISCQTASPGRRSVECGSTPRPPPAAARRARRPC